MVLIGFEFGVFLGLAGLGLLVWGRRGGMLWLLAASLIYAGWAGRATLVTLIACTVLAYLAGQALQRLSGGGRRALLWLAVGLLLAVLGVFKYAGFAGEILAWAGWDFTLPAMALPLGVSFFTFQLIAYLLDVYHQRIPAETNPTRFGLFVALFPKLLAGPIERGRNLLPQLAEKLAPQPERMTRGLQLILWGLFLKLVLADRLAGLVSPIFASGAVSGSLTTLLAVYMYSFQIYFDFAAYSLLAVGAGRLLGIELMQNFRRPYLATSIQEFWARWHISLTTWFRDYLYIPAVRRRQARSANRQALRLTDYQILLVFVLSGLWHGAGWTFVVWGGLHGLLHLGSNWGQALAARLPVRQLPRPVRLLFTFNLVALGWVFFRAESLPEALRLLAQIGGGGFSPPVFPGQPWVHISLALGLGLVFAVEVLLERRGLAEVDDLLATQPGWRRWLVYYGLLAWILVFGVFERSDFIYFQF